MPFKSNPMMYGGPPEVDYKCNIAGHNITYMDFQTAVEIVRTLFIELLEKYNSTTCQCAYPRYRQLMAIDCVDTSGNYSCYETELLIELSKPYFNWSSNNLNPDSEWSCKKCGSRYTYEWADFSIHVNRQTVKMISLNTDLVGLPALKPIPLFLGLSGHAFAPVSEIRQATQEEFEAYMWEV